MSAEPLQIGQQKSVDLNDCVLLGKLVGVWGVKGWLKVFSYTRPRNNIGQYKQWLLVPAAPKGRARKQSVAQNIMATAVKVQKCKEQGQNIVARIADIDYRDQAEGLFGLEVYIEKSQLKPLKKGEFYWSDMIGCDVINTQDQTLGTVASIMETGANDVLVVQQSTSTEESQENLVEHLIPYSDEIVLSVDADNKLIHVDWGVDYLAQERDTAPHKKKQSKQERAEEVRLQKIAAEQKVQKDQNPPESES